jgi:hypothetical protein
MKPQQAKPSYFKQNIQRNGENFLDRMNADVMQRESIRAIRDLARGNVNIENEGHFFLNRQFLENCLIAINSKYTLHCINFNAVNALVVADPSKLNDVNTQMVLNYDQRSMIAYGIVLEGLNAIQATGDLNYLYTTVNKLKDYKYDI